MTQVNQVLKKCVMTKWEVVKYQLLTYCFFNKLHLSDAEIECLVLLATDDNVNELNVLCKKACEMNIFKTPQSVRNSLNKLEKKGIVTKKGKNRKKLSIDDAIGVVKDGNVLLNYNFLSVETTKS